MPARLLAVAVVVQEPSDVPTQSSTTKKMPLMTSRMIIRSLFERAMVDEVPRPAEVVLLAVRGRFSTGFASAVKKPLCGALIFRG
jgi:hypothetical protein